MDEDWVEWRFLCVYFSGSFFLCSFLCCWLFPNYMPMVFVHFVIKHASISCAVQNSASTSKTISYLTRTFCLFSQDILLFDNAKNTRGLLTRWSHVKVQYSPYYTEYGKAQRGWTHSNKPSYGIPISAISHEQIYSEGSHCLTDMLDLCGCINPSSSTILMPTFTWNTKCVH